MPAKKFESVAALMDAHDRGDLDGGAFNDELWQMLAALVQRPADRER